MVWPATPRGIKVELDFSGDWSLPTDITSYVYSRDNIEITRGTSAEAVLEDPSTATITLNNRDGRFSPRNPNGAYYGDIGRNTPIRISVNEAGNVRQYPLLNVLGSFFTPDSVANSIVGDIDIRADLEPSAWRFDGPAFKIIMHKDSSDPNRSWYWAIKPDGTLIFYWWPTGSAPAKSATSTVPVPFPVMGRKAIRVVLDVDNGAANNTVTFYTGSSVSGTWTQLGDPVVQAGVTSIANTTSGVSCLSYQKGEFYAAQVRNGIAGTVVLNPDFSAVADGATVFVDSNGATWTALNQSRVTSRRDRFYGEVSSWPVKWDTSGSDIYVNITASGILRRLNQGASQLQSTLYRGIKNLSGLLAYWPAEDGSESLSIASAISGTGRAMKVTNTPDYASYSEYKASQPIPVVNGSVWKGDIAPNTNTNQFQLRFLLAVPTGTTTVTNTIISRIYCNGSAAIWDLVYQAGGLLALRAYSADFTLLLDTGYIAYGVDGKRLQISIELIEAGANVTYNLKTLQDDGTNGLFTTGSLVGQSVDNPKQVVISPAGGLVDVAVGHIYVQNTTTNLFDLANQLKAFNGETAGTRIKRLCGEEGVAVKLVGDPADTEQMGPQAQAATLLDLLKTCAEVDMGTLGESRTETGLLYRTRTGLLNQNPMLSLDYSTNQLSIMDPVDDDSNVKNDITISRLNGSSYRVENMDPPLAVYEPSDGGIGRYSESVTLQAYSDNQLKHLAGWSLRNGTIDEARYPSIGVDLSRAPFIADLSLQGNAVDTDTGHFIQITNPPAWLPPDTIKQVVRGYKEVLGNFIHTIDYNTSPSSPWTVAIYDDSVARYSSNGSTLLVSVTSGATALSVSTSSGPLWTTAVSEFPFDIIVGGECMTVTAIAGATSPQTFTVVRSVNGVVKAQSALTSIELFQPSYYSL